MTEHALPSATVVVTPSFHDCDPMGVVWHGSYLRYFERAREELFRSIGYGYREMKESGYTWPVIDVRVRYRRPLMLEEPVTVEARITEFENRLTVEYRILGREGQVMSTGYTAHMAYDLRRQEGCLATPKVLWDRLGIAYPE